MTVNVIRVCFSERMLETLFGARAQASKTILEVDRVIMPVHLGNHWTCALIDLKARELRYFDSMLVGALSGWDLGQGAAMCSMTLPLCSFLELHPRCGHHPYPHEALSACACL